MVIDRCRNFFQVSYTDGDDYKTEAMLLSSDYILSIKDRVKEIFLRSFTQSYEISWRQSSTHESIENWLDLNKPFRTWLEETIEEEIATWKKGEAIPIFYFANGDLKGFISLDPLKTYGDLKVLYGRQGALDPSLWGQGVVPRFYHAIPWNEIAPEANILSVLVRKINIAALRAYDLLGFSSSLGVPPDHFGYSEKYIALGKNLR